MNQYLFTAVIDAVLASFALRRRGESAPRALALTLYAASAWSLELYALSSMKNGPLLDLVFHITRWGMFFIPPCFALFTWRLLNNKPGGFLTFCVIPGFFASAILSLLNLFFLKSTLIETNSGYLPQVDVIYVGFILSFLWCFLGSLGLSILSLKSATSRTKQKVKWLLITVVVCFVCGIINLFLMPSDFYLSKYMGSVTNILCVGILFYSTVQHHVMDVKVAISVGLARAILLGFMIWVLFLFISLAGPLDLASGSFFAFIILIVSMLELYPRILNWALPSTKKFISGDAYDFEKAKYEMQKALNDCTGIPSLVSVLDYYLLQVINVKNYRVALVNEKKAQRSGVAERRKVFSMDTESDLVKYASSVPGIILSDETPENIQDALGEYAAVMSFAVRFKKDVIALVLIGGSSRHYYYSYDDIKFFEWMQLEFSQVLYRLNRLDEMQVQLAQAKKTLSMLGVMNHYHHDIKAPLAIIDGVLSNDIYDKEKQKDIVLQQVERGSRLIATMAGILKGERRRKVQQTSLKEVVNDSLFLFSQGIDEISVDDTDSREILADAEDLKILVINLLKNAVEARRPDEALKVTVRIWAGKKSVFLSIRDNGVGFTSDQLDDIWTDGFSSKQHGSGIGLQAIKRIADEHMATVTVTSERGHGSEFVFEFTDRDDAEAEERAVSEKQLEVVDSVARKKPLTG